MSEHDLALATLPPLARRTWAASAAFGVAVLVTGAAYASDLVVPAADKGVITAQVNGQSVRLRVDFDAPAVVLLNPAAAARVGLRPGFLKATAVVGPVELKGNIARAKVGVAGSSFTSWSIWFDRDYAADVDGVVSPAILPFDSVAVQQSSPVAEDKSFVVPVEVNPPGQSRRGILLRLPAGGGQVLARFSLTKPTTMATAPAGSSLAGADGGQLIGAPLQREIAYGVVRPVRTLQLTSPLKVGDFNIRQMEVRAGDLTKIRDAEASVDPDEVIVVARPNGKPQEAFMTVGADHLAGCASITFYRNNPRLAFVCRP